MLPFMKLNKKQKAHLAKLLSDTSNIFLGSLTLSQFIGEKIIWQFVVLGAILSIVVGIFSLILSK